MHGDTLCTDDVDYIRFRKKIRHPIIKFLLLLSATKKFRQKLANNMRARSKATMPINPVLLWMLIGMLLTLLCQSIRLKR